MAKFCERCPMAGDCQEDILGMTTGEASYTIQEPGIIGETYNGNVAVLYDSKSPYRPSRPIKLPPNLASQEGFEHIDKRVENCSGVVIEEKVLAQKNEFVVTCPALGALAVGWTDMEEVILKRMRGFNI